MSRSVTRLLALVLPLGLLAACGDDDDTTGAAEAGTGPAESEGSTSSITLGYSAWPGWFPLAATEEAGSFDEVGLDVDLTFFADYLASIKQDARSVGTEGGSTVGSRASTHR